MGKSRWVPTHRDRAAVGLSHVETPRADGSQLPEWEGALDPRSGSESKPAGSPHPPASVSTSAQWRCWRFLCPTEAVPREGSGPEGVRGWSLAGPPAVFGLEVWRCSCGYGEGGTLLSWDLCKVCSPGNSPRSLTTWSRAPSPDA